MIGSPVGLSTSVTFLLSALTVTGNPFDVPDWLLMGTGSKVTRNRKKCSILRSQSHLHVHRRAGLEHTLIGSIRRECSVVFFVNWPSVSRCSWLLRRRWCWETGPRCCSRRSSKCPPNCPCRKAQKTICFSSLQYVYIKKFKYISNLGLFIPKTQSQFMPKVVARLACHNRHEIFDWLNPS